MIVNKALHRIQTGEATPSEARRTLREIFEGGDLNAAPALYSALRSWTWKALSTRRFDKDMEAWLQLLQAASLRLRGVDERTSHYVVALSDLVDESLRFAPMRNLERLLTRSHVGDLLAIVRHNNGRIERIKLEVEAGLSSSRLSQLLTELTVAGALEREVDGRKASFVLTDVGREILERWTVAQMRPRLEPEPELAETFVPKVATEKSGAEFGHDLERFIVRTKAQPPTEVATRPSIKTVRYGGKYAAAGEGAELWPKMLHKTSTIDSCANHVVTSKPSPNLKTDQLAQEVVFAAYRAVRQGEPDYV